MGATHGDGRQPGESTAELLNFKYPGMRRSGHVPKLQGSLPTAEPGSEQEHDIARIRQRVNELIMCNGLLPGSAHCFDFAVDRDGRIPAPDEKANTFKVYLRPTTWPQSYDVAKLEISLDANLLSLQAVTYLMDNLQAAFPKRPVSLYNTGQGFDLRNTQQTLLLEPEESLIQITLSPDTCVPAVLRLEQTENGKMVLRHIQTGNVFQLPEGGTVAVNRRALGAQYEYISRRHTEITVNNGCVTVVDCDSTNRTRVSVYQQNNGLNE